MLTSSLLQHEAAFDVQQRRIRRMLALPDKGRAMGTWVLGSRGSGKSRLVGRGIIWQDFQRGYPTILLDPVGGTIDNFLDKVRRLDEKRRAIALRHIRYIDVAGTDTHVVPFPLLYRATSPHAAAQRFIELVRRTDPDSLRNPQLGFNAIKKIGTDVGMILSALDWQLSEAEALLRDPGAYATQIRDAEKRFPEIQPAAAYLLNDYAKLPPQQREFASSSYLRKIADLSREPSKRAIFAADTPGLSWNDVVSKRLTVLLDFSHVPDADKQFFLMWLYYLLMEWLKLERGTGRHDPLSVVIDELSYLVGSPQQKDDILAQDLSRYIAINSRNSQVWMTVMNQEMNQLSPELQATLVTLGNQIYGSTTDPVAAQKIAKRFYPYLPNLPKRHDNVWATVKGVSHVIDRRPVDFSIQEQVELNARQVFELPRMTFLVGVSPHEGTLPKSLTRISIEDLDRDQFPDDAAVARIKHHLMRRDGQPIQDVLATIAKRLGTAAHAAEPTTGTPTEIRRRPRSGDR